MGRCYKCGQPVPGDVSGQLCSRCQKEVNDKRNASLNKTIYAPARHFCSGCGKLMRESQSDRITVSPNDKPDPDGFYHVYDVVCSDCAVRKVKKGGKVLKFFFIIFLIGALVYGGGLLFNKVILGTDSVVQKGFEKNLQKVESDSRLIKDVDDGNEPGATIAGYISEYFEKDDYHLFLYTDKGKAEVQKHTSLDKSDFYFKFDKGYDETLADKLFVISDGILYAVGDEKIAYYSSSAEYTKLCLQLNQFMPDNICLKEPFNSQSTLKTDDYMIDILYADGSTVYMDWNKGKFYEKKGDNFIYMTFSEQGKGTLAMSKPKLSDCQIVE